jgi:hypothetical protein
MLYGRFKEGSLETFKSLFPALWADIEESLVEKGLDEEEVVYMLYNQESSPRLPGFTKNPFFFGHDMGHNIFDSEDSDEEFKVILNKFVMDIFNLYLSEEEDGKTSAADAMDKYDSDEALMAELHNFFDNPSGSQDAYGDVFAVAAKGELNIDIPRYITVDTINVYSEYYLPEENRSKAEALASKVKDDINKYLNSNYNSDSRGPGPLQYFKGSVILNDV